MKSIVLREPGVLELVESAEPTAPGAGEALVRVHRIGICGTDIHAFRGKQPFFTYPRIVGHELGVEVLAVGTGVTNVRVGDRCAVEPYMNCEVCVACRRGKGNCCVNMQVLGVHVDGGMRERFVLPAKKLHSANALSYEQIALVETLGIGAHAVTRAGVERGENVLVIGAGPIGLSVLQFVKAANGRAMVVDVSESRLAFCQEKLAVSDTINAASGDALAMVRGMTNGEMATAVFDATGNAQSMMGALGYVAHGGRLVYVGLFQGDFLMNDPEFHKRETTLMGSRNALPEDFRRIIELVEKGVVETRPWITHRGGFDEVVKLLPEWVKPESGVLKAVVEL